MNWDQDEELSVRSYCRDGHWIIEAVGSVVLSTTQLLAAALRPGEGGGTTHVTMDLRLVKFLDSSGLVVLVMGSRRLRSHDIPLAPRIVVTPGHQPERVLFMGRFNKILEIAFSLDGETGK